MSDSHSSGASPDPKQGLSLDSLADEIEGKENDNSDLMAGLINLVSQGAASVGTNSAAAAAPKNPLAGAGSLESAELSLFGSRLPNDLKIDLGGGVGKIHHQNGDLTVYNDYSSYTQTVRDGGFYRVNTEAGEVIFHLRLDGDIDLIAPNYDDTLRRVNAGAGIFFWTNESGSIRITFDEQRGFSTSSIDKNQLAL
ncbi:MAG: hypothetical protein SFV17_12000 [Candidatus Obscuribacter sp.]|nr:hypothetical protein [Candidatus Obscuribacter sp.]